MRGAYGKPLGTVARVNINQIMMSVRAKENHRDNVVEAFRRAKFKFPGRQKIFVSKKWGFTKYDQPLYEEMRADGRLKPDGIDARYRGPHGPFANWVKIQKELRGIK